MEYRYGARLKWYADGFLKVWNPCTTTNCEYNIIIILLEIRIQSTSTVILRVLLTILCLPSFTRDRIISTTFLCCAAGGIRKYSVDILSFGEGTRDDDGLCSK